MNSKLESDLNLLTEEMRSCYCKQHATNKNPATLQKWDYTITPVKNKSQYTVWKPARPEVARKMAAIKQNPEQKLRFGASPPRYIFFLIMVPTPPKFNMDPEA